MDSAIMDFVNTKSTLDDFVKMNEEIFKEKREISKQLKQKKEIVLDMMREKGLSEYSAQGFDFKIDMKAKLKHDIDVLDSVFADDPDKVQNYLTAISEENSVMKVKKRKRQE